MAGYNRIIIVGNLTRDPEHKQLSSGQVVCRLGLATNRQFKNRQNGEMVQEVCYIDIDVWGAQAESCRQYLQKGRSVLIEGRLKFDTWEDQNGQTRNKHSVVADRVVFLGNSAAEAGAFDEQVETPAAPQTELERNLLNQIDQIKQRTLKAAQKTEPAKMVKPSASVVETPAKSAATPEVTFKDEPPFEDLPF